MMTLFDVLPPYLTNRLFLPRGAAPALCESTNTRGSCKRPHSKAFGPEHTVRLRACSARMHMEF